MMKNGVGGIMIIGLSFLTNSFNMKSNGTNSIECNPVDPVYTVDLYNPTSTLR